jgi:REP element-mobilizing transposase RayT
VQVPCRVHTEAQQEAVVWANQPRLGIGSDQISEREKLDLGPQNVERKLRNFLGHKFWARDYFVSTCGRDEETIHA